MGKLKGATEIMNDEALSFVSILNFLWPYDWVFSTGRAIIVNMGQICGKHGSNFIGVMVKLITFLMFMYFLWVPLNVFLRFGMFWFASGYRIWNSKGSHASRKINGKQRQNLTNWGFFSTYTFLFIFVYIPIIIPTYFNYLDYSTVLRWLKIM